MTVFETVSKLAICSDSVLMRQSVRQRGEPLSETFSPAEICLPVCGPVQASGAQNDASKPIASLVMASYVRDTRTAVP
jgi:hypothetical protein